LLSCSSDSGLRNTKVDGDGSIRFVGISSNGLGRRTIIAMLLIVALVIIWNLMDGR
jgi:hypothetical protein